MVRQAEFLEKNEHRMSLHRAWTYHKPQILFIGINPSTANGDKDDATIRRLIGFCEKWGCGGFHIVNLFTYVTPKVSELKKVKTPCHRLNNHFINLALNQAGYDAKIVFMWGNKPGIEEKAKEMVEKFPEAYCFGKTKNGHPKHPLFLSKKTKLIPYNQWTKGKIPAWL